MQSLRRSGFTQAFLEVNGLRDEDFGGWVLCSGMRFGSDVTWWGDRARRKQPHEGLDLAVYRGGCGHIVRLDGSTRLPVLYGGVVVGVFGDFLGRSLLFAHPIVDPKLGQLFTAFGHTKPDSGVVAGREVEAGEAVASVADPTSSRVDQHVHISVGWARDGVSGRLLDWGAMSRSEQVVPIDPLEVIGAGPSG